MAMLSFWIKSLLTRLRRKANSRSRVEMLWFQGMCQDQSKKMTQSLQKARDLSVIQRAQRLKAQNLKFGPILTA